MNDITGVLAQMGRGSGRSKVCGYPTLLMPDHPRSNSNGYVLEHIVVAEKALGKPLPPMASVHHINEDRGDCRNQNLVICQDEAYHRMIHARMNIVKAGGNPDRDKVCGRCKRPVPRTDFNKCAARGDGLHDYCKACVKIINRYHADRRKARASVAAACEREVLLSTTY